MHLVGYFYETYHDARSPEHTRKVDFMCCYLLVYDTMSSARSLPVFQENISTVKVQAVCSSETAVPTYQTRRFHNPEIQNPLQKK